MKKLTLSHKVVALLFLIVLILLVSIAYIGSQQTQVYRSRASYPYPYPSKRPTATPIPENPLIGWVENASCSQVSGWAGEKNNPTLSVRAVLYADGKRGSGGTMIEGKRANIVREAAVCRALGGTNCEVCPSDAPQCKHGFSFTIPSSLKDGNSHRLYVYATKKDNDAGSEREFTQLKPVKVITCKSKGPPPPP